MARRAIWKGVVSFKKIRVPVKLYSAVENTSVSFNLLHEKDKVRVRQQMICALEDKPVESDEIVKGLEIDEDRYVLLEPDDLAELEPDMDRTIEVTGFVAPEEVDPRYFDRPYHLGPDGETAKYASLAKALREAGRLGLCNYSFRKRFYNAVLSEREGVLELVTLRMGDEVVDPKALETPDAKITQKETKMARFLLEELSGDFDASQYKNDFQHDLQKLIEKKARGGKITKRKGKAPEPTKPDNLIDLLEASLKRKEKQAAAKKSPTKKKSTAKKKASSK